MQALLASLVVGMSVKDTAFRSAMAANRADVKRTGQDFDRSADQMGSAIERAAKRVNAGAIRIIDSFHQVGAAVADQGLKLTAGLTLPLGLLANAAGDTASDFQAAMNKVHSAMVSATPEQLDKLREAALEMGPAVGKSAIEAAGAIESLAKNGMDAAAILGGGLESALKLAVVGQTDLGAASDATTDILQQFHLSTSQLPNVVDKVSGALDASKLSFDGYKDAIGMVGGIAGGLGYSFDDMNTALAAVIPLMTGGSDAGTSFKTFLLSLLPQSKQAAGVMDKLGISFRNTDGSMKTLGEAAEVLNTKLAGLTDASKQDALTKMFGTDGMRVALALMKAGAKGISDTQSAIDRVTAQQKIAILLDGEAAATQRLASSWEKLKIVIGEAGIIQAFTLIKEVGASMLSVIGSAPPWFMKVAVATGALAASIGPLTLAALGLAKIALPLLLLRLGPVAIGFAAIINPAGVLLRLLGQLALKAGAASVIGRLGTSLIAVAGPIGLVIAAATILFPLLNRVSQASAAAMEAGGRLSDANAAVAETAQQLATAEGKARDAILAKAKADRIAAADAIKAAKADMVAARAAYARAKMAAPKPQQAGQTTTYTGAGGGAAFAFLGGQQVVAGRRADLKQRMDNTATALDSFAKLDALISSAENGSVGSKIDMSFDDADKKKGRTKKGRDAERDEAQYQDALGSMRVDQLRANAELTESAHARYDAEMASIAEERASFIRRNAADDGLTAAKRATLLAAKDEELAVRKQIAERQRFVTLTEQDADMARTRNEAEQELARATIDLADSAAGRKAGEQRLLALQRQQEEADLELVLATKASATAEYQRALDRKGQLDKIYGARSEAIDRNNEGAGERYLRELGKSSDAMREDFEAVRVDALKGLNSDLTDAIMGTKKLGDAFQNMGKRIMASLIDIAIQQKVIRPLAEGLFGAGSAGGTSSGGGGMFASIASGIGSLFKGSASTPAYGGGRATGGPVAANRWYTVGERGPERFFPGISGTVIPNEGRGADRGMGGFTYAPVINAQGAGPREIDALRAELRQQQRELPGTILATMSDAASRGMTRR